MLKFCGQAQERFLTTIKLKDVVVILLQWVQNLLKNLNLKKLN